MKTSTKFGFLDSIPNGRRGRVDTCGCIKNMGRFSTVIVLCLILVLSSCAAQSGQVSPERTARNVLDSERKANTDALRAERAARNTLDSERKANTDALRAEAAAKLAEAAAVRAESAAKMAFPEIVQLHIKADPQLNYYQAGPHTLLLCIYHLKDSTVFNQLIEEKDGPGKLLECGRFDTSVLKSGSMIIQPSQEVTESLGRVEGARHVAIIAGYYNNYRKERIVRSFRIPGIDSTSVQKMGTLYVDLYLGPQGIVGPRKR